MVFARLLTSPLPTAAESLASTPAKRCAWMAFSASSPPTTSHRWRRATILRLRRSMSAFAGPADSRSRGRHRERAESAIRKCVDFERRPFVVDPLGLSPGGANAIQTAIPWYGRRKKALKGRLYSAPKFGILNGHNRQSMLSEQAKNPSGQNSPPSGLSAISMPALC